MKKIDHYTIQCTQTFLSLTPLSVGNSSPMRIKNINIITVVKLILVLILCFPPKFLSAQYWIAFSGNSRFIAVCNREGRVISSDSNTNVKTKVSKSKYFYYKVDAYDLMKKEKVSSFRLKMLSKQYLDTMTMSYDGRYIQFGFGNRVLVAQSIGGAMVGDYNLSGRALKPENKAGKKTQSENLFTFANYENLFAILLNNQIRAIECVKSQVVFLYSGISSRNQIKKLFYSPNDKYLVAVDRKNSIFIWRNGQKKYLKRLLGSEVCFSENMKYLTLTKKLGTNLSVTLYSLPDFKKVSKISANKMINKLTYENKLACVKESKVSCQGTYLSMPMRTGKKAELTIIDIKTTLPIITISSEDIEAFTLGNHWANDSILFLDCGDSRKMMFNVNSQRFVDVFNYEFEFGNFEYPVLRNRQLNKRVLSPDYRFVALDYENFAGKGVYLKTAPIVQPKSTVQGLKFLTFSPDSKWIMFMNKDSKLAFLSSMSVAGDLNDGPLTPQYFADTIAFISESKVSKDGVIPDEYDFQQVKGIRPIDELYGKLNFNLKTIMQGDSFIEVQFHLIDENGVYYFGAAQDEWKKIFCNVVVMNPDGTSYQADDFKLMENNKDDKVSNAIAVTLDHSGSMGEERTKIMQAGTAAFSNYKDSIDGISVIKYDSKTIVESSLHNDIEDILRDLKINGLKGYGGGTALLDGINTGIGTIKDAKGFDEKSIILFTDGNENSSFLSKRDVVVRALESNVKIHTIGFGDYVSEDYLKAISDYTGGSFYRLYRSADLSWIFNDVYDKNKNYYTIKINAKEVGTYRFFLKLCPPVGEPDSLMVSYNYIPNKLKMMKANDSFSFSPLIKQIDFKQVKSDKTQTDITNFNKVKIVPVKADEIEPTIDTIDESLIVEEFEKIVFPDIKFVFDQTEIVPGTDKELIQLINFMKRYPATNIEISGHTDEKGTQEYNQDLSERRAQKVKFLMIEQGIDESRITAIGYGKLFPIDNNKTEKGRQANRRVEFKLID